MRTTRTSLTKSLLTGVFAGITATVVMDQFLALAAKAEKDAEKRRKLAAGESPWLVANEQAQKEMQAQQAEGSTDKVARAIASAANTSLPDDTVKAAGQAVHYTFGTLMGVVYSAAAEWYPEVATGGGTAFGTLLFLGADEVAVPAFHLAAPPTETPASDHLQHWAAHVVYGGTLELARNLLRRLI